MMKIKKMKMNRSQKYLSSRGPLRDSFKALKQVSVPRGDYEFFASIGHWLDIYGNPSSNLRVKLHYKHLVRNKKNTRPYWMTVPQAPVLRHDELNRLLEKLKILMEGVQDKLWD